MKCHNDVVEEKSFPSCENIQQIVYNEYKNINPHKVQQIAPQETQKQELDYQESNITCSQRKTKLLISSLVAILALLAVITTLLVIFLRDSDERNKVYQLIKLPTERGAKCLDGSPTSIYLKKGRTDKFILYFNSGGWCGSYTTTLEEALDECLQKTKTDRGTSNVLEKKKYLHGFLSNLKSQNPYFYDYTSIFVNYCDGMGHQGYRELPYNHKDNKLWFRGKQNTLEVIKYAMDILDMGNALEVIVSGHSAGGLATFTWVDYISDQVTKINPEAIIIGVPDAGFFVDSIHIKRGTKQMETIQRHVATLANQEVDPIVSECVQNNSSDKWKQQKYLKFTLEKQFRFHSYIQMS